MSKEAPVWDMSDMVVLLPWREKDVGHDHYVRCGIEQMGGNTAYTNPPKRAAGRSGPHDLHPSEATHEYVAEGTTPTTRLPVILPAEFKARFELARAEYAAFLEGHAKPAFIPVVKPTSDEGKNSRYFGKPWMPDDMEWPQDAVGPMNFVMQLNTANLPDVFCAKEGEGEMLLFFHSAFQEGHSVRVNCATKGSLRECPKSTPQNAPLAIVSWRKIKDYPPPEDFEGWDPAYSEIWVGFGSPYEGTVEGPDGKERSEKKAIETGMTGVGHCFECDKLGGWPSFQHGDRTPKGANGQRMDLLFQVGYEGLLLGKFVRSAIEWPVWGKAHVFGSTQTGNLKHIR